MLIRYDDGGTLFGFQQRHPRIFAAMFLFGIAAYACGQTYFIMSPQDRGLMLKWWVIALALLGLGVLVGIGVLICRAIDRVRPAKPESRGFDPLMNGPAPGANRPSS